MLAKLIKGLALTGILGCALSVDSPAQQPPSSRYQPVGFNFGDEPVRQDNGPPSVHIPPQSVQALPERQSENRLPSRPNSAAAQGASHVFSDAKGTVRQTSFAQDSGAPQEPSVPEILQRSRPLAPPTSPNQAPARVGTNSVQSNVTQGLGSPTSPQQFANQMSQLRKAPPTDAKVDERLEQMKRDFESLQQKTGQRGQNTAKAAASAATSGVQSANNAVAGASTNLLKSGFSASIPDRINSDGSQMASVPVNPQLGRPSSTLQDGNAISQRAANPNSLNPTPSPAASSRESVKNFFPHAEAEPASGSGATDPRVHLASMQELGKTQDAELGQPESAPTVNQLRADSTIRLSAPSISVESFGPKTIGVNKPAIYKVVATNETSYLAERVVVYIDLPKWVEIEKVNMTAGERQLAEEKQQSRLAWKIEQIPGNGSQTLTITAIPRKAEAFDLGIEWTIAPRAGTANIQVTQPKLEMTIVGPEEVHFGDSAPYEVTVRNAGNGQAENVFVMLSEALGGQRAPLGNIPAGSSKVFTVNLEARTPGEVELAVSAVADNQTESNATRKLVIRRANLGISITGPSLRYAGTHGDYLIKLTNTGDATAEDVVAALGLPSGVKFLGGIEAFKLIEGGLRWQIGRLEPGQSREYKVSCQLDASGDIQLEVGTQAKGALQAAHSCVTKVQTIADLVMQVNDPPGPLTTGEEITYEIVVENRGTKTAKGVDIFMILSEGMEPKSGSGLEYRIPRDGALQFATVPQIDPGQKISLKVNAVAYKPGTHVFRAHLVCEEADAREIKEGTSRFFGEEVNNPLGNTAENPDFNNSDFQKKLK